MHQPTTWSLINCPQKGAILSNCNTIRLIFHHWWYWWFCILIVTVIFYTLDVIIGCLIYEYTRMFFHHLHINRTLPPASLFILRYQNMHTLCIYTVNHGNLFWLTVIAPIISLAMYISTANINYIWTLRIIHWSWFKCFNNQNEYFMETARNIK